MNWCRENDIKITGKIKSDMEAGLKSNPMYDQYVAGEEHHKFGVVDGFISAARHWNAMRGHGQGMTWDNLETFVDYYWNKAEVPGTHTTREEMIKDEDLEEALIAKNLYANEVKYERREQLHPET
jgi:hypothetical protein